MSHTSLPLVYHSYKPSSKKQELVHFCLGILNKFLKFKSKGCALETQPFKSAKPQYPGNQNVTE